MSIAHKIVKHTLKVLQQMIQDFKRLFDHCLDTFTSVWALPSYYLLDQSQQ